ncbi:hypothetical protein DYB37_011389 [Aphanomyces astaci]|uniref:Uncharacterized protein n=1 Tax=Aphanomyces astaci TaxID=112090 RepID=A0A418E2Q2_APHAT|nr:hypothetical protein DYB37_011389 [Aphanomyces astaci]
MSHRLSVPDTPEPERLKPSSLECHVSDFGSSPQAVVSAAAMSLKSKVSMYIPQLGGSFEGHRAGGIGARILQLDKFVRGYFILETLELDQVVASLEDSLDQAYVRVQALQDELKAMVHTHKRKIAEAKLMAVIHDATYD